MDCFTQGRKKGCSIDELWTKCSSGFCLPGLANPVTPVFGLLVVVGVEVEVVEDDGVGGSEVDAQAAGLGRQDENEDVGVFVELVDQRLTLLNRR